MVGHYLVGFTILLFCAPKILAPNGANFRDLHLPFFSSTLDATPVQYGVAAPVYEKLFFKNLPWQKALEKVLVK